jgi:hypothetical protein
MTAAERKEAWKGRRAWMWLALFGYAMNLFLPGFWIWGAICTVLFALCFLPEGKPKYLAEPDPDALTDRIRAAEKGRRRLERQAWDIEFIRLQYPQMSHSEAKMHAMTGNFLYEGWRS